MQENLTPYQPGAMLHDAIMGAFRAKGCTFQQWCTDNGTSPSAARNATYGQMRGPKGKAMRARLIDAAGPDTVRVLYNARLADHVQGMAAQAGAAE